MNVLLNAVLNNQKLSSENTRSVMKGLLAKEISPIQVGALLAGLRVRGETAEEIMGFVEVLLEEATLLPDTPKLCLDTCGTGGDGAGTFNISTAVSLVCAAGGIPVAKHGNRSVSSKCGSADVLEALEIPMNLTPTEASKFLHKHNFVFLYAPHYHQAFKEVGPIRKELGVRTVFNLLGPLLNPAKASRRILGVYDFIHAPAMAETLNKMGVEEAFVLSSRDGMDEISLNAITDIIHLKDGKCTQLIIDPKELGLTPASKDSLEGGSIEENKDILLSLFSGEKGSKQDIVAINAAAAFMVTGKAQTLEEGLIMAKEILSSGAVLTLLEKIKEDSHA